MSAGFVGFIVDGEEKLTYIPGDGDTISRSLSLWLHTCHPDVVRNVARGMRLVTNADKVKVTDISRLKRYADPKVEDPKTWFDLLWSTRQDVGAILAAGVIQDIRAMPLNWKAIQWGYVIDLDNETLNEYEELQLVQTWPLSDLPVRDTLTEFTKEKP